MKSRACLKYFVHSCALLKLLVYAGEGLKERGFVNSFATGTVRGTKKPELAGILEKSCCNKEKEDTQ